MWEPPWPSAEKTHAKFTPRRYVTTELEISFTPGPTLPLIAAWPLNTRPLITRLYVVLLRGLGLGAGALLLDARAQYKQLKQTEAISRQRLAEAEARLREQKKILERLRTDPDYVEKVIRKRLGYARPGEVIFLFPD